MEYLTEEWLDETLRLAAELPSRTGVSGVVQFVVTGGPDGTVKYYWVLQDGAPVETGLGETNDPDVTLTTSYEDGLAIQRGEVGADTAFMQGRMKAVGDMRTFLMLLPLTASPEHRAFHERLRSVTEC